jgi:hypothetical protein
LLKVLPAHAAVVEVIESTPSSSKAAPPAPATARRETFHLNAAIVRREAAVRAKSINIKQMKDEMLSASKRTR